MGRRCVRAPARVKPASLPRNPGVKQERFGLAVFLMIVAVFLFDIQGAIIKHMGSSYPIQQIAVIRNVFGLVPSIIMLLLSREWHRTGRSLSVPQWKIAFGRGLVLTFAQFCLYTSFVKLEFATASALAFAGPIFITTLSIPILAPGFQVAVDRRDRWLRGYSDDRSARQRSLYTVGPVAHRRRIRLCPVQYHGASGR